MRRRAVAAERNAVCARAGNAVMANALVLTRTAVAWAMTALPHPRPNLD